ncbi:MAG: AIR synthase-related protein [Thermoplasmata archaeon]
MGKIELEKLINLIEKNRDVMVRDNVIGSDFSTINLPINIIVKIEPMMYYEFLTPKENATLSYIFIQNDFLTSGIGPEYAMIDFESPDGANDDYIDFIQKMYEILRSNRVKLATAHTGNYGNIKYGIAGSIALIAYGKPIYGIHRLNDESSFFVMGKLGLEYMFFKDKIDKKKSIVQEKDLSISNILNEIKNIEVKVEYIHDIAEGGLIRSMEELSNYLGRGLRISENEMKDITPQELLYLKNDILSVSSSGSAIISVPRKEKENFKNYMEGKVAEIEVVKEGLWLDNQRLVSKEDKLYEILKK